MHCLIRLILNILKNLKAKEYVSGPSAKSYINSFLFKDSGIELKWFQYKDYQKKAGNELINTSCSIIEVIAFLGPDAKSLF